MIYDAWSDRFMVGLAIGMQGPRSRGNSFRSEAMVIAYRRARYFER